MINKDDCTDFPRLPENISLPRSFSIPKNNYPMTCKTDSAPIHIPWHELERARVELERNWFKSPVIQHSVLIAVITTRVFAKSQMTRQFWRSLASHHLSSTGFGWVQKVILGMFCSNTSKSFVQMFIFVLSIMGDVDSTKLPGNVRKYNVSQGVHE